MLDLLAIVASLVLAATVTIYGQERAVKPWYVMVCLSCATIVAGLWVEVHVREWAFFAARVNVTAGIAGAFAGLLSVHAMFALAGKRVVAIALVVASAINVLTVWLTDWYFTGE